MQKNVLEYLEASAARFPEKVAFSDETEAVHYGRLLQEAKAIGTFLSRRLSEVNVPVAVLIGRTACSITAMQGILAAGCCYVPIDQKMPELRARKIIVSD